MAKPTRKMKTIKVVDHDPNWKHEFEVLKEVFTKHLADETIQIEHVGSTSVEGIKAKPILDINVIIQKDEQLPHVINKLAELGYVHRGDLGITGREAFKRHSADIPRDGSGREWLTHHLYVCKVGNIALMNHLNFRDYLRSHPAKAAEYSELKSDLAQRFTHDIDAYIDGKTDFILAVLDEVGIAEADRKLIEGQNKR